MAPESTKVEHGEQEVKPPPDSNVEEKEAPASGAPSRATVIFRYFRWTLAVVLATGSVALVVASYWYAPLRICRDVTVVGLPKPVSCSPWALADLLPLLIPSVLLLFPELGELTIMNVFSLKRKTEVQQKEIDATKTRQIDLELRFANQVATLTAAQNLTQNFYNTPGDAKKVAEEVDQEEAAGRRGSAAEDYANRGDPYDAEEQEMLREMDSMIVELLREWDTIDVRVNPRRGVLGQLTSRDRESIAGFSRRHSRSINTIRAVRNSVAHGQGVPYADLAGALDGAKKLNSLLNSMGIPPF
ncbi:hypothetical protein [Amycolatopsis sp. SID8362]|uniref:hypothetical protein n=1 Tax=Amycolatopsis sp. SID8362 TaxID=2690346 RepID=UPI00136C6EB2|nr:hypothetical protein [Amycolatopsis sp. SID8362]NBH09475.1 hypothetical protein [Amycolatopsis sp. SID8362]NED46167.1 hypothetical protein [Amycolatopsis sp. SID8362]